MLTLICRNFVHNNDASRCNYLYDFAMLFLLSLVFASFQMAMKRSNQACSQCIWKKEVKASYVSYVDWCIEKHLLFYKDRKHNFKGIWTDQTIFAHFPHFYYRRRPDQILLFAENSARFNLLHVCHFNLIFFLQMKVHVCLFR